MLPTQLDMRDNYGMNAIHHAVLSNNSDALRLIAGHLDVHSQDESGNNILHFAAQTGSIFLTLIVVEELGIQSVRNIFGQTPLHVAENSDVVTYLINIGVDVNQLDLMLWSPLHHAAYHDREECTEVLIMYQAHRDLQDIYGKTALDYAMDRNPTGKIAQMLAEVSEIGPKLSPGIVLEQKENLIPQRLPEDQKEEVEVSEIFESVFSFEASVILPKIKPEVSLNKLSIKVNSDSPDPSNIKNVLSGILLRNNSLDIDEMLNDFGVEIIKADEMIFREELGKGGFGVVYRGYFRDSEVAIKVVKSEGVNDKIVINFLKEIQCLLKIRHTRFILIIAVCIEGPLCIITELAKRGNLASAVRENKLTLDDKHRIALQIAEGMSFIHNKRPPIVHRDLKPQNILLDKFNQVKIADLGLSRSAEMVANTAQLESTEVFAGTIRYMAPELYDEQPMCHRATDVWAYGCLLLHLFTGKEPWDGLELTAVQRRLVLKMSIPIDHNIDSGWAGLIEKCCNIESAQRPRFHDIKQEILILMGTTSSQV